MFQGVMTAIVTPFDEKGLLDEQGLRQNIHYQLSSGVDGLVPLGTTGEAPTLTAKEKIRVIEITLEEANGRVPVIVGTGSYSTQTTIESTLQAKNMGADGALIVTPYYNKPTQEGIYRHFIAVAEAADLPIIVYNHQGRTGQNTFVSTIQRLAAHPRIVGVKDSSGSIVQMMEVFEAVCMKRKDFSLLSGDDPLTLPCMAIGGHGIISVLCNLIPAPIIAMVKALRKGEYAYARDIHYRLQPLFRAAFIETNPIPLKAAMNYVGLPAGDCRLPLCEMLEENKATLIEALEAVLPQFHPDQQLSGRREAPARL